MKTLARILELADRLPEARRQEIVQKTRQHYNNKIKSCGKDEALSSALTFISTELLKPC